MNANRPAVVLVVDDEPSICWGFQKLLAGQGHTVLTAGSAEAGLKLAAENPVALVLLDVRLPGESGLSALPKFHAATGGAPVVVMTAFGDLETAVTAVRQGASDYLTKPFRLEDAAEVCERALRRISSSGDSGGDPPRTTRAAGPDSLVGSSPAMQKVFRQIALVADSDLSVLITGETGTGKELVAAAIHRHSRRKDGPYLAIAPVALSPSILESELFGHVRGAFTGAAEDRKGIFETAAGGTILLDEIGDLPLSAQVKLLRVLEQRQFTPVGSVAPRDCDVRILAATHRDLRANVAAGGFRLDLLYRLTAVTIELPPLRERPEDIAPLANHFLTRLDYPLRRVGGRNETAGAASNGQGEIDGPPAIDDALLRSLCRRPWLGNVRELKNAIEHAAVVARGRPLELGDFPDPQTGGEFQIPKDIDSAIESWVAAAVQDSAEDPTPLYDRFLHATEPALIRAVLNSTGGNRAAAAERLGMHRATLRQRMQRYAIE
jgi:two-component system nitrogen regulation response regulator GlnG